jgi:hypothetical protein
MGNYRFQLNAKSVDITAGNHQICLTIDINEDKIDDLLQEMPIEKIFNHLEGADVLNANLFLKYCTLEDVFEHFNPAELKNRLAQYLLEL